MGRSRAFFGAALIATAIALETDAALAGSVPADLTSEQEALVKAAVADNTSDPDAVKFRKLKAALVDQADLLICGEMNDKNAFGGYIGYRPFVVRLNRATQKIAKIDIAVDEAQSVPMGMVCAYYGLYEPPAGPPANLPPPAKPLPAAPKPTVKVEIPLPRLIEQEYRPAYVTYLIEKWVQNVQRCKGVSLEDWDKPETLKACDNQVAYEVSLDDLGWCYGRRGDRFQAAQDWHKCQADSFHPNRVKKTSK